MPFTAAHTHIAHTWQYPRPLPRGLRSSHLYYLLAKLENLYYLLAKLEKRGRHSSNLVPSVRKQNKTVKGLNPGVISKVGCV